MERQHLVFIAAAAAAFAALIVVGVFNSLQQTEGDEIGDDSVIKARKGQEVFVRYSPAVVKMIQDLPSKNSLKVEVSSELQNTNLAGLRGEIRYTDMEITFVQEGEEETVSDDVFKTIEYRFLPDRGNKTSYVYENVRFLANSQDSQVIVAVEPLSTAKVGEQYTVRLILDTGGVVNYAIGEKIIEVIP